MRRLLAALLLLPLALPAWTRERERGKPRDLPEDVEVMKDLGYAKVGDRALLLDLYRPAAMPKEPLPAVLFIHGGAWRTGDRSIATLATDFVRAGYVYASIGYRLSVDAPYPAAFEDCKAAVRWFRERAKDYGADPTRIGLFGASAGGHLAMLVGGHPAEGDARVQAVCSWFGLADLSIMRAPKGDPSESLLALLGGTAEEKPEAYREASPVTHVTPDDPPVFLVHGDADALVPLAQSELMLARLKEAKVDASLLVVKRGDHGFKPAKGETDTDPPRQAIHQATVAFFDRILKSR